MDFDRRDILIGLGAAAALVAVPASANSSAGDATVERLLAARAEELLATYPEQSTVLGIDTGVRGDLKSRLTDRSPGGVARVAASAAACLKTYEAINRTGLSAATLLDLDVVTAADRLAVEGSRFPFGDVVTLNQNISYRNTPYVVAQNTGAFVEVPDFLDSQHKIERPADADAYLARLEAYAAGLDGETARIEADAASGVILPAFLLHKTLTQIRGGRAEPVAQSTIVASLAKRTVGMPGNYAEKATRIVESQVLPALDRQIAALAGMNKVATNDAGVWKLPDGEAYYAWALRAGTTSSLKPEEVHELGLEQTKMLYARMEPLLRAQGLTQGSVGARMAALGKDPSHQFANTDAGRAEVLAYVNGRIADIRTRLPRAFATLVPGNIMVKRVPPAIENGAPDGYAGPGSIDGSTPGFYYINLRDTSIWPKYELPTLSYHEGIPGHVWQGEYTYKLPLIRSLLAFNAYSEGWALYAEQLGDELGAYDDDPLGRLGYLHSLAYRACRLVVDTGIHAKHWSRDRAIEWFVTNNGSSVADISGEIDRYCAWPGQACGYKVGHSEINRQRDKARAALGSGFDLRRFDDAIVLGGNVPLSLLDSVTEAYIAGAKQ